MSAATGRIRRLFAAAGAVLATAAAVLYVARTLRERARGTATHRGPSAGRPLRVVRGGAGEG
ncbi:MAG TPA: hypothetical protein VF541_20825 [Longimicrobium sp.]